LLGAVASKASSLSGVWDTVIAFGGATAAGLLAYLSGQPAQQDSTNLNPNPNQAIPGEPELVRADNVTGAAGHVFVNQTGTLEAIRGVLAAGRDDDRPRVVRVLGPAGIGTSSTCVRYAVAYRDEHSVCWRLDGQSELTIKNGLEQLARQLLVADPAGKNPDTVHNVLAELRQRGDYLLIYDNVASPDALPDALLPRGPGAVLISSTRGGWRRHADLEVELPALPETDSVALLRQFVDGYTEADLTRLARHVGTMPLALVLAACYLAGSRASVDSAIASIDAGALPGADDGIWRCTFQEACSGRPDVGALLGLFAVLNATDVPRAAPHEHAAELAMPLRATAGDLSRYDLALGRLATFQLIWFDEQADGTRTVNMHPMIQLAVRRWLGEPALRAALDAALALLLAAFPEQIDDPANWPSCLALTAHALTVADHVQRLSLADLRAPRLLHRVGRYLHRADRFAEAASALDQALAILDTAPDGAERAALLATVYARRSRLNLNRRQFEQASSDAEAAVAQARRDTLEHADALLARAQVRRECAADYQGAIADAGAALRVHQALLDPGSPTLADTHRLLARMLLLAGDFAAAREHSETAVRILRAQSTPDPLVVGESLIALGTTERVLGRLDDAVGHLRAAHTLLAETLDGDGLENTLKAAEHLADALVRRDGAAASGEALALLDDAVRRRAALDDPDHPNIALARLYRADALRAAGRLDEALADATEAERVYQLCYPSPHPYQARAALHRGLALLALNRMDDAAIALRRALELYVASLGPDHLFTADAYDGLAAWADGAGHADEAIRCRAEARRIRSAALHQS
jgi:tetratricopeptide (TPR) repeat protein